VGLHWRPTSSLYRLAKGVLRGMMKARHGRIIQIGSVSRERNAADELRGCEGGARRFTKSLAQEGRQPQHHVNCLPGLVDTE